MNHTLVALLVPRAHVKKVKTALEEHDLLNRTKKISVEVSSNGATEKRHGIDSHPRMVIYTNLRLQNKDEDPICKEEDDASKTKSMLVDIGLEALQPEIASTSYTTTTSSTVASSGNPLLRGLNEGLHALPVDLLSLLELSVETLVSSFPDSYSVYKPMLLLPHNAFASAPWARFLASHPIASLTLQILWEKLAAAVGATHVAINAGIPLDTDSPNSSHKYQGNDYSTKENILRSPVNLVLIYGDFGPQPTTQHLTQPTSTDFDTTLWVSHTQNGIHQTWAPLYTMFSRGNIREKTRLLTLPSMLSSVSEGKGKGKQDASTTSSTNGQFKDGCTAVDLYAGIGYFAFPYKKAGVSKVLCWELNPWSIEGLRRGAEKNGWSTQIFTEFPEEIEEWLKWGDTVQDTDFLVFQQSNEHALSAVLAFSRQRDSGSANLPPVRHVNCGFLPSSQLSWATAVKVLDQDLGGWIHAHENVGAKDIEKRKERVVAEMQAHVDEWEGQRGWCGSYRRRVRCEHIERVKTYAPGVLHVVFDVWVDGVKDAEDLLGIRRDS